MFKVILKYLGYFSAFTGAIGVVAAMAWGIATWVNERNNEVDQTTIAVQRVEQLSKQIIHNDSIQTILLRSLSDDIGDVKTTTKALDKSYRDHLKADKRYDELILYMEEFKQELKKNGTGLTVSMPANGTQLTSK